MCHFRPGLQRLTFHLGGTFCRYPLKLKHWLRLLSYPPEDHGTTAEISTRAWSHWHIRPGAGRGGHCTRPVLALAERAAPLASSMAPGPMARMSTQLASAWVLPLAVAMRRLVAVLRLQLPVCLLQAHPFASELPLLCLLHMQAPAPRGFVHGVNASAIACELQARSRRTCLRHVRTGAAPGSCTRIPQWAGCC